MKNESILLFILISFEIIYLIKCDPCKDEIYINKESFPEDKTCINLTPSNGKTCYKVLYAGYTQDNKLFYGIVCKEAWNHDRDFISNIRDEIQSKDGISDVFSISFYDEKSTYSYCSNFFPTKNNHNAKDSDCYNSLVSFRRNTCTYFKNANNQISFCLDTGSSDAESFLNKYNEINKDDVLTKQDNGVQSLLCNFPALTEGKGECHLRKTNNENNCYATRTYVKTKNNELDLYIFCVETKNSELIYDSLKKEINEEIGKPYVFSIYNDEKPELYDHCTAEMSEKAEDPESFPESFCSNGKVSKKDNNCCFIKIEEGKGEEAKNNSLCLEFETISLAEEGKNEVNEYYKKMELDLKFIEYKCYKNGIENNDLGGEKESGFPGWGVFLIIFFIVLILGGVGYYFYRKRKLQKISDINGVGTLLNK